MSRQDAIANYLTDNGYHEFYVLPSVRDRFDLDKYRVFKNVHFTFVGKRGKVLVGHSLNPKTAVNFTKAFKRVIEE